MICGVMQMNWGTKTITLHSNQQWGERIAKTMERRGGFWEQVWRNTLCIARYFSHLCFSLAYDYDYFTIDDVVKQMKWMLLLLYFCPNVKKSFLFKVSSVDSQKMITKYFLAGACMADAKKRILNIILYLLALLLLR
jgi:hypothetical protein